MNPKDGWVRLDRARRTVRNPRDLIIAVAMVLVKHGAPMISIMAVRALIAMDSAGDCQRADQGGLFLPLAEEAMALKRRGIRVKVFSPRPQHFRRCAGQCSR